MAADDVTSSVAVCFSKMIALEKFKTLLGKYGETLTDQQIQALYDMENKLADIMFDQWVQRIHQKRLSTGYNLKIQDNIGEPVTKTI